MADKIVKIRSDCDKLKEEGYIAIIVIVVIITATTTLLRVSYRIFLWGEGEEFSGTFD